MTLIERLICLLIGYVFGCIQNAYIVGRFYNVDIRDHGSGNAGSTNAVRVLGRKPGIVVFALDILKAAAAFMVAALLFDGGGSFFVSGFVLPGLYAGAGAILGHDFPVVLKFKGGKGIACSVGLILMLDWRAALIIFIIAILVIVVSRFISTASLLLTALTPVLMGILGYGMEAVIVSSLIAALAWWQHRENIRRLLSGTERKFTFNKA